MPENHREIIVTSDDLGRDVRVPVRPQRIVSLCPSQTETLLELGAGERLVGRTRYCIHPEPTVIRITEVGGTKQLRVPAIEQLKPDLVIAEKEENRREDVELLAARWPVFVTDVRDIASGLRMISTLGRLCGCETAATGLIKKISTRWRSLKALPKPRSTAYLIWRKPWMAAGADTYIHDVLTRCGLVNVFAQSAARYPETTMKKLAVLSPELVLLSTEPYPFKEKHRGEFAKALPQSKVLLVDGEAFSWYGARMLKSADVLQGIIDSL